MYNHWGMEQLLNWLGDQLIPVLVSSGALFWSWRATKRLKNAEAKRAEQDNEISITNEWIKVADERERKIQEKDNKIDALYLELANWRDKYNTMTADLHGVKLDLQTAEWKVCNRRSCTNRTPPSDF